MADGIYRTIKNNMFTLGQERCGDQATVAEKKYRV